MPNEITKVADLIIPEVMESMLASELPKKIKFLPIADVDYTLVGQPGDTITVPYYEYTGDAKVVAEGEPIDLKKLRTNRKQAKVEKVADGFQLTDESVLSGYGDPIGAAQQELLKTISAGVDNAVLEALATTTLSYAGPGLNLDTIDSAIAVFNDEDVEDMVLFANPKDAMKLRKAVSDNWTRATDLGDQMIVKGTFGEVLGAQVYRTNKLNEGTMYLVKKGALKVFMKRKVQVEYARDITTKMNIVTADQHFAASLFNPAKALRITVTA